MQRGELLTFYHGDVVSSVANGERDCLLEPLDKLHNQRLLQGRDTAADHCLA